MKPSESKEIGNPKKEITFSRLLTQKYEKKNQQGMKWNIKNI